MKRYQRILICIEERDRDGRMLDYTGAVCRVAETKEVHLLHVRSVGPPAAESGEEPAAPPEVTLETLQSLAAGHLRGHGNEEVICQVVTGTPLLEILRYALDKDIDLIVMGRAPGGGKETTHEAVLDVRVTRKATCSVLVLPRDARTKADKILVPVRYSECSANALKAACDIAAGIDGAVCALNVFPAGSGHSRVRSTLKEHMGLLERGAQRECERLLVDVETAGGKVETRCVPDLYSKPVAVILDEIEKESADLVVIGARGRTGAAGVLLGAVTEALIRQSPVPVLAVKKKGECIGVLRALLILAG